MSVVRCYVGGNFIVCTVVRYMRGLFFSVMRRHWYCSWTARRRGEVREVFVKAFLLECEIVFFAEVVFVKRMVLLDIWFRGFR